MSECPLHGVGVRPDHLVGRRLEQVVASGRVRCETWSGDLRLSRDAVGRTTVIADGGYRSTGLAIPHRREHGQSELPAWKEEQNTSHRRSAPVPGTPSPVCRTKAGADPVTVTPDLDLGTAGKLGVKPWKKVEGDR